MTLSIWLGLTSFVVMASLLLFCVSLFSFWLGRFSAIKQQDELREADLTRWANRVYARKGPFGIMHIVAVLQKRLNHEEE